MCLHIVAGALIGCCSWWLSFAGWLHVTHTHLQMQGGARFELGTSDNLYGAGGRPAEDSSFKKVHKMWNVGGWRCSCVCMWSAYVTLSTTSPDLLFSILFGVLCAVSQAPQLNDEELAVAKLKVNRYDRVVGNDLENLWPGLVRPPHSTHTHTHTKHTPPCMPLQRCPAC